MSRLSSLWEDGVLPFAGLLVLVLAMLTGCAGSRPDITTANTVRLVGHAGVVPLTTLCLEPAEAAEKMSQADAQREFLRLSRLGCIEAGKAHTALVEAHEAVIAVSEAIDAGECLLASRSAVDCNIIAAASKLTRASGEFTTAIEAVKRRAK